MKRLLLIFVVAGCQPAPVGVRNAEVQRDSTAQCAGLCSSIGLPLDSVVIMADNVGCVCRAVPPGPPATTEPSTAPAASSAGGMAAIMIAQEAARRSAAAQAAARKPK